MAGDQKCRGTNILAVKTKLLNPQMIFKQIPEYNYDNISPTEWYPMEQFTKLTDYIEKALGKPVLMKIGRGIIPEMKEAGILPFKAPEDLLDALPAVYLEGNSGSSLGQWKLLEKGEKHYTFENSTMHNCHLEEGIIYGGVEAFGGKFPKITQKTCVKNGDSACHFDIKWS